MVFVSCCCCKNKNKLKEIWIEIYIQTKIKPENDLLMEREKRVCNVNGNQFIICNWLQN